MKIVSYKLTKSKDSSGYKYELVNSRELSGGNDDAMLKKRSKAHSVHVRSVRFHELDFISVKKLALFCAEREMDIQPSQIGTSLLVSAGLKMLEKMRKENPKALEEVIYEAKKMRYE